MAAQELPMPEPTVPVKPLTSFKVLTFDIYGTLIDWETGITKRLYPLIEQLPSSSPYKTASDAEIRKKLAGLYGEKEAKLKHDNPKLRYNKLLAQTYIEVAKALDLEVTDRIREQAEVFGAGVGEWEAFPDTVEAITRLSKYYNGKLVPLSNIDNESFARTNAGPLQGLKFWRVYTAQDIGSYKPSLNNFEYLLKHLDEDDRGEGGNGISKEDVLHVAQSIHHDHIPAKKMGMSSAWINRQHAVMGLGNTDVNFTTEVHEQGKVGYGWRFTTLKQLADEVESQFTK